MIWAGKENPLLAVCIWVHYKKKHCYFFINNCYTICDAQVIILCHWMRTAKSKLKKNCCMCQVEYKNINKITSGCIVTLKYLYTTLARVCELISHMLTSCFNSMLWRKYVSILTSLRMIPLPAIRLHWPYVNFTSIFIFSNCPLLFRLHDWAWQCCCI